MGPTYEFLCNNARKQSESLGRYAAVVDVTHYMQSGTRTMVAISTTPIVSRQRGPEFIGVGAQWYKGQPYGAAAPARSVGKAPPVATGPDGEALPF